MENESALKKGRSPNSPKIPLVEAIELARKLHDKAGKAKIRPDTAAGLLGYGGVNGAVITILGTLNQYGLIDRSRGEGLMVSELAVRLIHPTGNDQKISDLRDAATRPRVFQEIVASGHDQCAEEVLSNHLIHKGFTQDGAKQAASVFVANKAFATPVIQDTIGASDKPSQSPTGSAGLDSKPQVSAPTFSYQPAKNPSPASNLPLESHGGKVLAQYSIPLGSNEATLVIRGTLLTSEDFEALQEYVGLFKRQFERKQKSEGIQSDGVSHPNLALS